LNQPELKLANLFRAEIFRQFAEVPRESIDVIGVRIDGPRGQIPHKHVFGHAFGNRSLPRVIGSWHRGEPHREVL
jgi:hypothetical protein